MFLQQTTKQKRDEKVTGGRKKWWCGSQAENLQLPLCFAECVSPLEYFKSISNMNSLFHADTNCWGVNDGASIGDLFAKNCHFQKLIQIQWVVRFGLYWKNSHLERSRTFVTRPWAFLPEPNLCRISTFNNVDQSVYCMCSSYLCVMPRTATAGESKIHYIMVNLYKIMGDNWGLSWFVYKQKLSKRTWHNRCADKD